MDANGENTPDFCPQPLLKVKTAHRFLQSLWAVFFWAMACCRNLKNGMFFSAKMLYNKIVRRDDPVVTERKLHC